MGLVLEKVQGAESFELALGARAVELLTFQKGSLAQHRNSSTLRRFAEAIRSGSGQTASPQGFIYFDVALEDVG